MKTKYTILIFIILLLQSAGFAQSITEMIKPDSINNFLRELSGDKTFTLDGNIHTISTRFALSNASIIGLPEEYIKFKFRTFGLTPVEQPFTITISSMTYDAKNIYAVQRGSLYPDKAYIICAHYDDEPPLSPSPGADDNGSGCVSVLEAARVISKLNPEYTIIYALWSGEEQGLNGSAYFAQNAYNNGQQILGVFNLDMVGYDGLSPNEVYIITPSTGSNMLLVNSLTAVNKNYNIGLTIYYNDETSTRSDQYSFLWYGYPSLLMIEQDYNFNPYYHSSFDNYANVDKPFLDKCAKAAIISLAELSLAITPVPVTDIKPVPYKFDLYQNYPNPFNPSTVISYEIQSESFVTLKVYDTIGREIAALVNEHKAAGKYQVKFSPAALGNLSSGMYLYKLQANNLVITKKMIYLK